MRPHRLAEAEFRPLGLSSRAINALWLQDICTLAEVGKLTEWDLSVMPGIGPKAISQLRVYLRRPGPAMEIHDRPRIVSISFEPDVLTAIDAWALDNGVNGSRAEAVRRLVGLSLARSKSRKK